MGITWKAMPLLSTLAALVIIVHSAEDFDPDYRDLRPRRLEPATPSYEQSWRAVEIEPAVTQSMQVDWNERPPEEPLKRRRPVRKRKRRPLPPSDDDLIPQERQVYHEEYRPYQNEKFNPPNGVIKRRRKQFDTKQSERPNTWTEETVDADRPLMRRRGHRRKRPSLESWTDLSEFSEHRPNENIRENNEQEALQPTEPIHYGESYNSDSTGEIYTPNDGTMIKNTSEERTRVTYDTQETKEYNEFITPASDDMDHYKTDEVNEDKSLSEFSVEVNPLQSPSDELISAQEKISDKSVSIPDNEAEKAKIYRVLLRVQKKQLQESLIKCTTKVEPEIKFKKIQEPFIVWVDEQYARDGGSLDPQTLKAILKRSNGKSLSEILQQHNLSLVDLLHGKEKAVSVLKIEDSEFISKVPVKNTGKIHENETVEKKRIEPLVTKYTLETMSKTDSDRKTSSITTENTYVTEPVTELTTINLPETEKTNNAEEMKQLANEEVSETTTKSFVRRRFPVGIRRKLRMRPVNNTTYKSQLSRDLITLTTRRYQNSRNTSRLREWKEMIPTMIKINKKVEPEATTIVTVPEKEIKNSIPTTTSTPEDTTIQSFDSSNTSILLDFNEFDQSTLNTQPDRTTTEALQTTTMLEVTVTEIIPTTTTTDKPKEKPVLRPTIKASDLRRQAFNNRLKRKRQKLKTSTTEAPQDDAMKDIFGMANLVSASEFIAKVQTRTTNSDDEHDSTTLEDFITTESSTKAPTKPRPTKAQKTLRYSTTHASLPMRDTEETAKIEIEEILNDTRTSARLSKILMERNMTINELVEHRERGSSHIHLADIFHNASREPNPPEPFLSKSLIEPISKETYPLRALLEANLHDPTAKATTIDPNSTEPHYLNIPVVMDFGNNVNENGENMGIMAFFSNFTKSLKTGQDKSESKYEQTEPSTQVSLDSTNYKYGTSREGRVLNTDRDLVTWREIIAIMHQGQNNKTGIVDELTTKEISPPQGRNKIISDDLDSDGLLVLEDLQHLKDFDNHAASSYDDKLEVKVYDKPDLPLMRGILNKTTNSAKSVTVATACIIGLALVLFLLTYAAFKWKQQRRFFSNRQCMKTQRIPTPVFEHRKGKNNSSTRSKSPMIVTNNIYTIDTLDTHNGNDSPEYMWDSLRKPFQ